jgi:hypothetical protein
MSKKFDLSEKRFAVIKKDEVRVFEDGPNKWATFTYPRWAHFVEQFVEISRICDETDCWTAGCKVTVARRRRLVR